VPGINTNMATVTVTTAVSVVTSAASATVTAARAPAQAGIFEGLNLTIYNPADPIILFIIQVTLVIALTRLLYWPLAKIREPRVIVEVITVSKFPSSRR